MTYPHKEGEGQGVGASGSAGPGHTLGPWRVTPMRGSMHYGVFQVQPWADRQRAMLRGEAPDTGSADEVWANARLIAAAPELLAALETARIALVAVADSAVEAGFDQLADIIDEQLGKANTAIARARGEA